MCVSRVAPGGVGPQGGDAPLLLHLSGSDARTPLERDEKRRHHVKEQQKTGQ